MPAPGASLAFISALPTSFVSHTTVPFWFLLAQLVVMVIAGSCTAGAFYFLLSCKIYSIFIGERDHFPSVVEPSLF